MDDDKPELDFEMPEEAEALAELYQDLLAKKGAIEIQLKAVKDEIDACKRQALRLAGIDPDDKTTELDEIRNAMLGGRKLFRVNLYTSERVNMKKLGTYWPEIRQQCLEIGQQARISFPADEGF